MSELHETGHQRSVAFVAHTRDYGRERLLPALAQHGYVAIERIHDRETERLLTGFQPDLVVLPIDPHQRRDLELVRAVSGLCPAPILVLAPGPQPVGFGEILEVGADVCLRETDGPEMLLAQIAAFARRGRVPTEDIGTIVVRDLVLDFDRCQASRAGELIPLTPTEFKVLALLGRNLGKVVGPVEILRSTQGFSYPERQAQDVVKVHIRRIRRKVEAIPEAPNYIVNVRGFGYMLERRSPPAPTLARAA